MSIQIGSIIGDYEVIGLLGAGGMGQVYKVRNTISHRIEAVKILLPDLANAPDLADRFLREIRVLASLDHPNIAGFHTAVRADNQLLMAMEFVEGTSVEHVVRHGRVPVTQAIDWVMQTLSALDYAHQHGVIHRDIKPANMMLTPTGGIKLMDFGIARTSTDPRLTMTGTTVGSIYYMSPEQIGGAPDLDARADIYSTGVTLYELITGRRPFNGDSQYAILAAHMQNTPVPPVQIDPGVPQSLNDAVLMAVARDRDSRFQTAAAFRNALGRVLRKSQTGLPAVSATPPNAGAAG